MYNEILLIYANEFKYYGKQINEDQLDLWVKQLVESEITPDTLKIGLERIRKDCDQDHVPRPAQVLKYAPRYVTHNIGRTEV